MIALNLVYLRKKNGMTQSEMSDFLGISGNTRLSDYERGKSTPPIDVLISLSDKFKISIDDLIKSDLSNSTYSVNDQYKSNDKNLHLSLHQNLHLNSKGSLLKESETPKYGMANSGNLMPKVVVVDTNNNENVVFIPVKARAGYLTGYGDQEYVGSLPSYRIPGLNNGSYRMFEVDGLSMYPTLNDNDIIIGQSLETIDNIKDDRVYVVVTKNDGIVVKRVLNRVKTDGKLILKSDNYKNREEYPNIVIDPSEVLEMWIGVFYISRYMKAPAELYTRMIDLEGKVAILEDKLRKK